MKKLFFGICAGLFIMNMPLYTLPFSLPSHSISSMYSRSIDIAKEHPVGTAAALVGAAALLGGSAYVWYKLQNMSLGGFYTPVFELEHTFSHEHKAPGLDLPVEEDSPAIQWGKQEESSENEIKDVGNNLTTTQKISYNYPKQVTFFDGFGSHLSHESKDGVNTKENIPEEGQPKACDESDLFDSTTDEQYGTDYQSFDSGSEVYQSAMSDFEQQESQKLVSSDSQMSGSQPKQQSEDKLSIKSDEHSNQSEPSLPEDDETEQSYLTRFKKASARGWHNFVQATAIFSRKRTTNAINEQTMEDLTKKKEEYESESEYELAQEEESWDPDAVEMAQHMTEEMAIADIKSLKKYLMMDENARNRNWKSQFKTALKNSSLEEVYRSITNEIRANFITAEAIMKFAKDNNKETESYCIQANGARRGLKVMTNELEKIYKEYSAYKK